MHFNAVCYNGDKLNSDEFLSFCSEKMTAKDCETISAMTVDQSSNISWYKLRYDRITASAVYEAAQCRTDDGSLVEKLLSVKSCNTFAMKRGKDLEEKVLHKVAKALNTKIQKCGLVLSQAYPELGASADGISENEVYECKCPTSEKNIERYFVNGQIVKKFTAQLHMQMLFTNKRKGCFCIAKPDFEKSGEVIVIREDLDVKFINAVIQRARAFWKKAIFPVLFK